MKKTAIVAIVEPLSFSPARSLAWSLTSTLKAKRSITLVDADLANAGELIGLVPILQPIRIQVSGQQAFFLAMRAMMDVPDQFKTVTGTTYGLLDVSNQAEVAKVASASGHLAYPTPFVLLAPELGGVLDEDQASLAAYTDYLTRTLWKEEPINWTTHRLQLASNGQFMTREEIASSGLTSGVPVFASGTMDLAAGPTPRTTVQFAGWRGAGKVDLSAGADASSSYLCTDDSTSSYGGSGDGDGSLGSGDGDGDGDGGGS
jgi:hypothetical protein